MALASFMYLPFSIFSMTHSFVILLSFLDAAEMLDLNVGWTQNPGY